MFLRTTSGVVLSDLHEAFRPEGEARSVVVTKAEVEFDLLDERSVRLSAEGGPIEVPFSKRSYQPIAKWLEVPYKFLARQERDLQQLLVDRLLAARSDEEAVLVEFDDLGVLDVRDPYRATIDPRRLVDIAVRVMDPDATVVEHHCSPEFVQFEVVVPEGFEVGWGGDPQEGDVTAGGLRFGQDRKRNLAPFVQPYLYRLACTNGYEVYDNRHKVDARGKDVNDLLMDLEMKAQRAFEEVEADIEALYRLRDERVDNPSQMVARVGGESGLTDRTVLAMVERVPEFVAEDGTMSRFDLVNLISNQANDPNIVGRLGPRRALEQAGGQQVSEHIARCRTCAARLN